MVKGYHAHTYSICHSSWMFGRSKFNDGSSEQLQVLYKSELLRLWWLYIFRFLDRCAWDTGYQPATMIEEGERLGKELGDKSVLFMCHHGTLVVADSIHVAFDEVLNPRTVLCTYQYHFIGLLLLLQNHIMTLTMTF